MAPLNRYVQGAGKTELQQTTPFSRFPTCMWANTSVLEFIEWLRNRNNKIAAIETRVAFYGLDLYSLSTSIDAVLSYLDTVDPETAKVARVRYGCPTPWANDLVLYARATMTKQYRACETDVLTNLELLLENRLEYSMADGERFFYAEQNARLVSNAERYYPTMYYAEKVPGTSETSIC